MNDRQRDQGRRHPYDPTARFDGGNLDCGSGLLLQIRRHIDPLERGQLLEICSTEPSVAEDLPAWCRMTGNDLVSTWHDNQAGAWSFLVSKLRFNPAAVEPEATRLPKDSTAPVARQAVPAADVSIELEQTGRPSTRVAPLSVMGIGSWPRPPWLLHALHERLEGRLDEAEFQALADRSVAEIVQRSLTPAWTS